MRKKNTCFNCNNLGSDLYGYNVCGACKNMLRLFTEDTVAKHSKTLSKERYQKDLIKKLDLLDKTYIKKRIKLLDILSKLSN